MIDTTPGSAEAAERLRTAASRVASGLRGRGRCLAQKKWIVWSKEFVGQVGVCTKRQSGKGPDFLVLVKKGEEKISWFLYLLEWPLMEE